VQVFEQALQFTLILLGERTHPAAQETECEQNVGAGSRSHVDKAGYHTMKSVGLCQVEWW
jgi:hypothetical protein